MPWRVAIGGHPTALPHDERGIWRAPDGEIEALVVSAGDSFRGGIAGSLAAAGWDGADAYVHWRPEYEPLPVDAPYAATRLCAVWGDWNVAGRALRLLRDTLAAAVVDLPGVEPLRRAGYVRVAAALPWGWDPATGSHPVEAPREIDVLFVGRRNPAIWGERERWLARLEGLAGRHRVEIVSGVSSGEFQALLRRAKLVFNRSVRGEANMRAFEAAAQGACVLNERGNVPLDRIFGANAGYASYDDDLERVVERLLADDAARLSLARTGQEAALRHSYETHLHSTLRTLCELCESAPPPTPPSAPAWREVLLEQWRLTRQPIAEAVFALAASLPRAQAARRIALDVENDPAAALAAGIEAVAAGVEQDAPFLLALAEAAREVGSAGTAECATAALRARSSGTFVGIPTPDYGDWRLALDEAVLAAPDDRAAAAEADAWVRTRARWILAAGLAGRDPASALTLLDPEAAAPLPLLFLRGRLRCRLGQHEAGLADLRRVAEARPTDPTARAALAEALAAA